MRKEKLCREIIIHYASCIYIAHNIFRLWLVSSGKLKTSSKKFKFNFHFESCKSEGENG